MAYPAITSYHWDFGDGATSSARNPSHTFTTNGVYIVSLTITNSVGDTDTKTYIVKAHKRYGVNPSYHWDFGDGNNGGGASITHIYPINGTYIAQLTIVNEEGDNAQKTAIIKNIGGPIKTRKWTFGDGRSTDDTQAPSHVYFPGIFDVSLTVTNFRGESLTINRDDFIKVETFGITSSPRSGNAPLKVRFRVA